MYTDWKDVLERWISASLFVAVGYMTANGELTVAFLIAVGAVMYAIGQQERFWNRTELLRSMISSLEQQATQVLHLEEYEAERVGNRLRVLGYTGDTE